MRFFISDINNAAASSIGQSELLVTLDDIGMGNPEYIHHIPGGCNILYMDGHVEFARYPGEFPICMAWQAAVELL